MCDEFLRGGIETGMVLYMYKYTGVESTTHTPHWPCDFAGAATEDAVRQAAGGAIGVGVGAAVREVVGVAGSAREYEAVVAVVGEVVLGEAVVHKRRRWV